MLVTQLTKLMASYIVQPDLQLMVVTSVSTVDPRLSGP